MKRTLMYFSAALSVAGVLSFAGVASAQTPSGTQPTGAQPAGGAAAAPTPQRIIAVFNMAQVMREFGQAKYQVYLLNKKKIELSEPLRKMQARYLEINKDLQANPNGPKKAELEMELRDLQRKAEDEDRRVNKELNELASAIISDLYKKIKYVVDKTAIINGYHVVFAYPDAVTEEEKNSSYVHELKLKPPAAQPFYIASHADITHIVVQYLNEWYKPVDAAGKPVDVNKLEPLAPTTPGSSGLPSTGQQPPATNPAPIGGVPPK